MTDNSPDAPTPDDDQDGTGARTGVIVGVIAVVLVAAVIVAIVLVTGGDDDEPTTDPATTGPATTTTTADTTTTPEPDDTTTTTATTTTTTTEPDDTTTTTADTTTTTEPDDTTTTAATTTTTAPAPTPEEAAAAVWPWVGSDVRYDEPMDAVEGFVVDYLELGEPSFGEFMAGDANSGEVEVRSGTFADPTVVSVRRFSDETWWVLGSSTANIVVDEPRAGDEIDAPLVVVGESTAPEATVQVEIRRDGDAEPLLDDFFTGGGSFGEMAPFEATLDWDPPTGGGEGALILSTFSSRDGWRSEATVLRVTFPEG